MPDRREGKRRWWPRSLRIPGTLQQEADLQAGDLLAGLLNQQGTAEVKALLARGEFVPAVRRVRELTGLRLIDAKRAVESLQR